MVLFSDTRSIRVASTNFMGKFTTSILKEVSKDMVQNGNDVSIQDLFFAIMALQECHVCQGYPPIVLSENGSVTIINPKDTTIVEKFNNLEDFVECMKDVAENWED